MRVALTFLALVSGYLSAPAIAQPADLPIPAATTGQYPDGVRVVKTAHGPVYANKQGHTLYGLDMRTVLRAGADPALYCAENCGTEWEPLLAPKDASPNILFPRGSGSQQGPLPPGFLKAEDAPDWTIIKGPAGPQYVFKGWHIVYVRKGEKRGGTGFDGVENFTWNSLKYVPPVPVVKAPAGVKAKFVNGSYALATKDGQLLFAGKCSAACPDWTPLSGGLASGGMGDWRVSVDGDQPHWTYKGLPVFVSSDGGSVPLGGKVLRP